MKCDEWLDEFRGRLYAGDHDGCFTIWHKLYVRQVTLAQPSDDDSQWDGVLSQSLNLAWMENNEDSPFVRRVLQHLVDDLRYIEAVKRLPGRAYVAPRVHELYMYFIADADGDRLTDALRVLRQELDESE